MDITMHQQRRPLVVTVGLALFVANQAPNLVLDAIRGNRNSLYFYIIFAVLLAVLFVPVWFILRGHNWARWLLAAIFFVGFCAHLLSFLNSHSSHSASWIALGFLEGVRGPRCIDCPIPAIVEWVVSELQGRASPAMNPPKNLESSRSPCREASSGRRAFAETYSTVGRSQVRGGL